MNTSIFESEEKPRAVIVSVILPGMDERDAGVSFDELERLLETAGGEVFARMTQARDNPDNATYIGKGKLEELCELCDSNKIELVVFDGELSPMQIRNIEDSLENTHVIDRSMLILDIFALHARSGEGKLQVELAQLKYTVPRLYGKGSSMSRLGGGIGTRGPGETKLEKDKRHVKRRIEALEENIRDIEKSRALQRTRRENSGTVKVAIVGYTNAGKSTLLNKLTGAGILAEDKLFATLDPTTRKFVLPSKREMLLTDTVGFIRNLPHHLIKAFRSTLDEAKYSDALLIIIDASDPECVSQLDVTENLLAELDAADKPIVYVFNKCDMVESMYDEVRKIAIKKNCVFISAKTGEGIDRLTDELETLALGGKRLCKLVFPMSEQAALSRLYALSLIESIEYTEEGAEVSALLDAENYGRYKKYIAE
ncbi:MAG: GTPase HflX [Clostridia bacterium]|nr:GTPase HflX [Clostridia bacterium]